MHESEKRVDIGTISDRLIKKRNITKLEAKTALKAFVDVLKTEISTGDELDFKNFVKFGYYENAPKRVFSKLKKEPRVNPSYLIPKMKFHRKLKYYINGLDTIYGQKKEDKK